MGNLLIDADHRFSTIQFNYYAARNRKDWVEAAILLEDANANLPPDAAVTDMPSFKFVKEGNRSKEHVQAYEYCNHWRTIVWRSIATYAHQIMNSNND